MPPHGVSSDDSPKLEKTSKLVTTTLLVQRRSWATAGKEQARKDKQALILHPTN